MSQKKLRLEILEKMATLATAGFGLVAAFAWNSAIQDLFKKFTFFGSSDSLVAKFVYAIFITAVIVIITYSIGTSVNKLKDELGINSSIKEKK